MKVKWSEPYWGEPANEGMLVEAREMSGEVIAEYRTFFGTHKFVVITEDGEIEHVRSKDCLVVAENERVVVKVKKLRDDATIPYYAHPTDAGMDMVATSKHEDEHGNIVYGFGLAFEIPEGYAGFLFPRSSNAEHSLILSNCVGIVDSGYRGEVKAKFRKDYQYVNGIGLMHNLSAEYEVGHKVAQIVIMPYPKVAMIEAETLSTSERGVGGYGSTGK